MYELHPNPEMGLIWLESENILNPGQQLHAFPLSDDDRSRAYLAWRNSQPPAEE